MLSPKFPILMIFKSVSGFFGRSNINLTVIGLSVLKRSHHLQMVSSPCNPLVKYSCNDYFKAF